MDNFVRMPNGSVQAGEGHDDLVDAFMMAMFLAYIDD